MSDWFDVGFRDECKVNYGDAAKSAALAVAATGTAMTVASMWSDAVRASDYATAGLIEEIGRARFGDRVWSRCMNNIGS